MTALVVDASVWVSAADRTDSLSAPSRAFLHDIMRRQMTIMLPAIARLEVACALARRLRDPGQGRKLAEGLLRSSLITEATLDASLLKAAMTLGTEAFLRAGDAFYAAVAKNEDGVIVTWDEELIRRVNAVTPEAWLAEEGGR